MILNRRSIDSKESRQSPPGVLASLVIVLSRIMVDHSSFCCCGPQSVGSTYIHTLLH